MFPKTNHWESKFHLQRTRPHCIIIGKCRPVSTLQIENQQKDRHSQLAGQTSPLSAPGMQKAYIWLELILQIDRVSLSLQLAFQNEPMVGAQLRQVEIGVLNANMLWCDLHTCQPDYRRRAFTEQRLDRAVNEMWDFTLK